MFRHYRTQGFVLKKVDRGEADQLFTIYTKDFGRLEILGRAIRKIKSKLKGGLGLFYLSEIEFIQGKTHKTLTDAILIENFPNLRKDLGKLSITYKISEVLDNLIKGQEPDEETWQLLVETFNELNTKYKIQYTIYKVYYYFLWNLFSILGYQPELYKCATCQKELAAEELYWSSKEGGLICQSCFPKIKSGEKVEPEIIKILRIILKKDWQTLSKLKIELKYLNKLSSLSKDYLFLLVDEAEASSSPAIL